MTDTLEPNTEFNKTEEVIKRMTKTDELMAWAAFNLNGGNESGTVKLLERCVVQLKEALYILRGPEE